MRYVRHGNFFKVHQLPSSALSCVVKVNKSDALPDPSAAQSAFIRVRDSKGRHVADWEADTTEVSAESRTMQHRFDGVEDFKDLGLYFLCGVHVLGGHEIENEDPATVQVVPKEYSVK